MFKRRKTLLVIPLIFVLLIVLTVPPHRLVHLKSSFFIFFRQPLSLSYKVYNNLRNLTEIMSVFSAYEELEREKEELSFQLNQLKEKAHENKRLHKILKLSEVKPYEFIVAQVIGKEPTNWLNSLIVNKGKAQGIKINQPVMSFSGLIGKVIEVAPHSAKILLISDVNSRVVVLVQRTREEGILEGIGRGLCRLKYLSLDAQAELGDVVISAGVGGVYPKGLVIGRIQSIQVERGGKYKSCIVKPLTALSGLEEVLCLK